MLIQGNKAMSKSGKSSSGESATGVAALVQSIEAKAVTLGKYVLESTTKAASGHPSSGLALAHLVVGLMYNQMRWDPQDPWNPNNDRLVLSEGHAVPIIYAALADMGAVAGKSKKEARKLSLADLPTLREIDSILDGHPNPAEGMPFFDAATGSLGQGLSVAAGLGLAARLRGVDKRIYCIIGDGESREGQIWEAVDFILDQKLTNVIPIFNCNGQGQADYVSKQQSADVLAAKLTAYGCAVEVINGNDPEAVLRALSCAAGANSPTAIVARTEKGWGVSSLKDRSNHGKPLTADKLAAAEADLDSVLTRQHIPAEAKVAMTPSAPAAQARTLPAGKIQIMPFEQGMDFVGLSEALAKGKLATRRAYGAALAALGKADERIVALDGDVSNSTFAEYFHKKFPDRFFECKIAEQNMISAAAGLAAGGYIPFCSSFAKFISRGYDQIEMADISRANIKIVGSHAGVSLGADGPSQMGLVDVAFFRSFTLTDNGYGQPACIFLQPSDAVGVYHCMQLIANHPGLAVMRTFRPDTALLYKPTETFEIGGSKVLCEGNALTVVANGYMVHVVKRALEQCEKAGIKCTLIDAYCFPMKAEPILAAAKKTGRLVLTVEDNYVGGLWSAVAEAAAEQGDTRVVGMTVRRIPKSGSPDDVLKYVGLSPDHIEARIKELVK
jgi:transketolase